MFQSCRIMLTVSTSAAGRALPEKVARIKLSTIAHSVGTQVFLEDQADLRQVEPAAAQMRMGDRKLHRQCPFRSAEYQ
jgi:hypothetical protein